MESVVIALRLGICVFRVRELVDSADSESTCWSALVSGISEAEASHLIDEYSSKKVCSSNFKPPHCGMLTDAGYSAFFETVYQRGKL